MAASTSSDFVDGDTPRFHLVNKEELDDFIDSADSLNTKKQIKYGMSIFEDFCKQAGANFKEVDNVGLDRLLAQFYAGARNQKGSLYSKKSMQSIRYGIQRHFLAEKGIDIVKEDFPKSSKAFKAMLVNLKNNGKAYVNHHPSILEKDMQLIQSSFDINTAKGLQRKVFVDTMVYFANRGMENLRQMKPDDFILNVDENNREFFTLRDMATKNHPDDDIESQGGRMYSFPGKSRCPVANLKMYKSKLNPNSQWMWQRPKKTVTENDEIWYDAAPLGKNTLSNMTKNIAMDAKCSKMYTNHCLRATSVTLLDNAGYASQDIMTVSGHKSETSIKNYVRTSEAKKRRMSDTISLAVVPDVEVGEAASDPNVEPVEMEPMTNSQCQQILNELSETLHFYGMSPSTPVHKAARTYK